MPQSDLDDRDMRILDILRDDSRVNTQAIADRLNMPRVTVYDRIRRLQDKGFIQRFTIELDAKTMDWTLNAFILANWHGDRGLTDRRKVAQEICDLEFVKSCHIVTGQWDFVIEVVARDMSDLGDSILDRLSSIEGMGHAQTMVSFYDYPGPAGWLR